MKLFVGERNLDGSFIQMSDYFGCLIPKSLTRSALGKKNSEILKFPCFHIPSSTTKMGYTSIKYLCELPCAVYSICDAIAS